MKKITKLLGTAILVSVGSNTANAGTVDLNMTVDIGSQWYDYISDSYSEHGYVHPIGGGDGFQLIPSGNQVGAGLVEAWVNDGVMNSVVSLVYDDITGNITGVSTDFDSYIADDDAITQTGYGEASSNVMGSVSLLGGDVTAINMTSDITFTMDYSGFGFGMISMPGTFNITGDSFSLLVDPILDGSGNPVRAPYLGGGGGGSIYTNPNGWNVTGSVTVVPVPAAVWLFGSGLLGLVAIARRRV